MSVFGYSPSQPGVLGKKRPIPHTSVLRSICLCGKSNLVQEDYEQNHKGPISLEAIQLLKEVNPWNYAATDIVFPRARCSVLSGAE